MLDRNVFKGIVRGGGLTNIAFGKTTKAVKTWNLCLPLVTRGDMQGHIILVYLGKTKGDNSALAKTILISRPPQYSPTRDIVIISRNTIPYETEKKIYSASFQDGTKSFWPSHTTA